MKPGKPSRTAQYAATVRAILADRGVVADPYAAPMLVPSMRATRALLRRSRYANSPFFAGLAARTLWFDHAVCDAIAAGIDQIVTVGAGYDSRAWRFATDGVHFFEVDHPATQADKQRRAPRQAGPTYVPVDLLDDALPAALDRAGFARTRPALFVIEGVTMYLDVEDLRVVLASMATAAAPTSRLAVNFAAPVQRGSRQDRRLRHVLAFGGRLSNEPFRSARELADPAALVAETGWVVVQTQPLRDVARAELAQTLLQVADLNDAASVVLAHA